MFSDGQETRRSQISPVYLSSDPKYEVDDVDFNLKEARDAASIDISGYDWDELGKFKIETFRNKHDHNQDDGVVRDRGSEIYEDYPQTSFSFLATYDFGSEIPVG